MNVTSPETSPNEEINLRFKDIYESAEWKAIHPISRAQLLLVAEGVKPGTIIGGDFTHFPKIIKKLGLDLKLESESNIISRMGPTYRVAGHELLSRFIKDDITRPKEYAYINGEFLGYPTCCTDEYCHPQHQHESNLEFELKKEIESTGTYPDELDFCPPSFTPCGANCPCASPLLKKWKSVIEKADPEAAQELREFHWRSEPLMKKIHIVELKKKRTEYRDKVGRIIMPN